MVWLKRANYFCRFAKWFHLIRIDKCHLQMSLLPLMIYLITFLMLLGNLSTLFFFLPKNWPFLSLSLQSQLPSLSNTHSSLSTSTGSARRHSLWRPSRACGLFAATTAARACPRTPTATLSCSGNSMLVCATGSCCPSVSCSPVPFWSVPSSCSTRGPPASLWVLD